MRGGGEPRRCHCTDTAFSRTAEHIEAKFFTMGGPFTTIVAICPRSDFSCLRSVSYIRRVRVLHIILIAPLRVVVLRLADACVISIPGGWLIKRPLLCNDVVLLNNRIKTKRNSIFKVQS